MGRGDVRTSASIGAAGLIRHRVEQWHMSPRELRALAMKGQRLGEGSFSEAWRLDGWVFKQIKSVIGRPPDCFELEPKDVERVAREIELGTKRLRSELGELVVPVRHEGEGLLRTPFVDALMQVELLEIEKLERASDAVCGVIARARRILARRSHGAILDGGSVLYPDGWRVWVDPERDNFRFHEDGTIAGWLDCLVVRPPDRALKRPRNPWPNPPSS